MGVIKPAEAQVRQHATHENIATLRSYYGIMLLLNTVMMVAAIGKYRVSQPRAPAVAAASEVDGAKKPKGE